MRFSCMGDSLGFEASSPMPRISACATALRAVS